MNAPQTAKNDALADWCRDIFEEEPIAGPEVRRAASEWEIERTEVGPNHTPSFVLSVHHKTVRGANRVLVATADIERVAQIERAAKRALSSLSSADFAALLKIPFPEE